MSENACQVSRVIAIEEHVWNPELRAALLKFGVMTPSPRLVITTRPIACCSMPAKSGGPGWTPQASTSRCCPSPLPEPSNCVIVFRSCPFSF
jgi:hypothetical protein